MFSAAFVLFHLLVFLDTLPYSGILYLVPSGAKGLHPIFLYLYKVLSEFVNFCLNVLNEPNDINDLNEQD